MLRPTMGTDTYRLADVRTGVGLLGTACACRRGDGAGFERMQIRENPDASRWTMTSDNRGTPRCLCLWKSTVAAAQKFRRARVREAVPQRPSGEQGLMWGKEGDMRVQRDFDAEGRRQTE